MIKVINIDKDNINVSLTKDDIKNAFSSLEALELFRDSILGTVIIASAKSENNMEADNENDSVD